MKNRENFQGLSLKSSSLPETFWDCPEIHDNIKYKIYVGVDLGRPYKTIYEFAVGASPAPTNEII